MSNNADGLILINPVNAAVIQSTGYTPAGSSIFVELYVDSVLVDQSSNMEVLAPINFSKQMRGTTWSTTTIPIGIGNLAKTVNRYDTIYDMEVLDQNNAPVAGVACSEAFNPVHGNFIVVYPNCSWNQSGFQPGNTTTDGSGAFFDTYTWSEDDDPSTVPSIILNGNPGSQTPVLQTVQNWKAGGAGISGISNTGFLLGQWTLIYGRGEAYHQ